MLTPEEVRQIEADLSSPPFRGVPIGSALASLWHIEVYGGNADWGFRAGLKNRARCYYHYFRPSRNPAADVTFCKGRVLVTCVQSNFRCWDLVFPVVRSLGYDRCAVFYADADTAAVLPPQVRGVDALQATGHDARSWKRDYRRFWRELKPALRRAIRQYKLPGRIRYRLADAMVSCTQQVAGLQEFLTRAEPAAVVTEYDRNGLWAPLVLSARTLGIPTYTLVHGTLGLRCNGFYPLLADTVFCWGEIDREKFLAAGVAPERAMIGGCPRLTRELDLSPPQARAAMGLEPNRPVVLHATVNYRRHRMQLTESFCRAAAGQDAFQAVVRLHPVETKAEYAALAAKYPGVRFTAAGEYPLDTALAAADVAVVHSSGLGGDALVKRRLTVVLDVIDFPLGHGQDLIDYGGCPRARSADELRAILLRLLGDPHQRQRCEQSREQFVAAFCAFFGDDSARRIADHVLGRLPAALASPSARGSR
jgi:hypothetical protein